MDRWSDSFGKGMGAEESNEGIARGESGPCFHWHLTPGLSQAEASTRRSDQLPGPIGFTLGFFSSARNSRCSRRRSHLHSHFIRVQPCHPSSKIPLQTF